MAVAKSINEELAHWVTAQLNEHAGQFSIGFLAKYDPLPTIQLKDLEITLLTIQDSGESVIGFASRSQTEHEYLVEITVWQKVESQLVLQAQKLRRFAQELRNFFRFRMLQRADGYQRLKRIENLRIGSQTQEDQLNSLNIVMTLVFRGWED